MATTAGVPPPLHAAFGKIISMVDDYRVDAARQQLDAALAAAPLDVSLKAASVRVMIAEGDHDAALEVALAVTASNPAHPQVVDAVLRCLSHAGRHHEIAVTYERLLPALPAGSGRKQVLEHLFNAYARLQDWPAAQKTAMKLKMENPGEPVLYPTWIAMCNLSSTGADNKEMLVKLAAAVMDKILVAPPSAAPSASGAARGPGVVGPQHTKILTAALERQNRFADAIELLSSPRARVLRATDRFEQLAGYYGRLGTPEAAALSVALYRHLWEQELENWTFGMCFADALTAVANSGDAAAAGLLRRPVTVPGTADGLPLVGLTALKEGEETAVDVVNGLCKRAGAAAAPRGLLLIQLELLQRAGLPAKPAALTYVSKNATRPSCFLDVIKYLSDYTPAEGAAIAPAVALSSSSSLDEHARNVVRLQLIGALGPAELVGADVGTMTHIAEVLSAFRQCPAPSEVGDSAHPWPQYLVTACNAAARRFAHHHHSGTNPDLARWWASLGFRISAIPGTDHKYPSVHLFALLFADALGYTSVAAVNALDFKSVQHDSMAFLCYRPLVRSSDEATLKTYAAHAATWYSSFERDTSNLVTKLFTNVAWTQLAGLEEFEQSVAASVARMEWCGASASLAALYAESSAEMLKSLTRSRGLRHLLAVRPEAGRDNDDRRSVAAAAILAMPGSAEQAAILSALVPEPEAPATRAAAAQRHVALLLCLSDMATHLQWLKASGGGAGAKPSAAPGGKQGKQGKAAATAAAVPAPRYLLLDESLQLEARTSPSATGEGSSSTTSSIAAQAHEAAAVAGFVRAIITRGPEGSIDAAALWEPVVAAYAAAADAATDLPSLSAVAWPRSAWVVCTLRLSSLLITQGKYGFGELPVKRWAQTVAAALAVAADRAAALPAASLPLPPSVSEPEFAAIAARVDEQLGAAAAVVVEGLHGSKCKGVAAALRAAATEARALSVLLK